MQTGDASWDDLRMLLAVYRGKSFLAAGKALGVATSTVARRIEALEQTLGRPIVNRSNGGTRVEPDVLGLVALGETLELGLDALRRDAREERMAGTVRISVSEGIVRPTTRVLARLRALHPNLAFELMVESRLADVSRHEVDLAVRTTRTTSPAVVERALGHVRVGLFAAREYVERRLPGGRMRREIAALHDWIGFDRALARMPQEQWLKTYGATRFACRSSSSTAIEQAVLAGMGIGLLGEAQGRALDGLVQLEVDSAPPAASLYLVFHRDAKKDPRVRTVGRALEDEVRRQLA